MQEVIKCIPANLLNTLQWVEPREIVEVLPNRENYFSKDVTSYTIVYEATLEQIQGVLDVNS